MAEYAALTPINIVTGFLGSGKTTLLRRLLRLPCLSDTAVLVNEFGEIGLDHHLLQEVAESTLLLENGCVCCAVRGDLQKALKDLISRRMRGEVPPFRRVVIETSGLADPTPIAYTLLSDAILRNHLRLSGIVTTIDGLNGADQLAAFPEAVKQVAVADRLILTKSDLADEKAIGALRGKLRVLNRSAEILSANETGENPERLLTDDIYDREGKSRELDRWLGSASEAGAPEHHEHAAGIHSFSLTFDRPLDWAAFGVWATMLLHRHGADVLRLKGLLHVAGLPTPVLINGVQHLVHPPSHLESWPDADRRSRLIFIVRGIEQARIERSLATFNGLVNRPAAQRV